MLLRDALGETLRDARTRQNRTLRDVSTAANVSLGYLSEVERGRKEAAARNVGVIPGTRSGERPRNPVAEQLVEQRLERDTAFRCRLTHGAA